MQFFNDTKLLTGVYGEACWFIYIEHMSSDTIIHFHFRILSDIYAFDDNLPDSWL